MKMLSKPIYPFQETVREYASERRWVGLGSFYGSGKTYLSLQWLADMEASGIEIFPCLILTQLSLLTQWGEQIEEHTDSDYCRISGSSPIRVKKLQVRAPIYILNYDAIRNKRLRAQLNKIHFKSFIIDESSYFKNARIQRFKYWRTYLHNVAHRCLLAGKPITETNVEIWAQQLLLDKGEAFGTAFWKFRYEHFAPGPPWKPYDWELRPGADKLISKKMERRWIIIPKDVVREQLPRKNYIPIKLAMPDKVRKIYKQLLKDFEVDLPSGKHFDTQWAVVKSQKLHQITQGFMYLDGAAREHFPCEKYDWLRDNLPLILDNGPILIWAAHRASAQDIAKLLSEIKIPYATFTGLQKEHQNEEAKASFQDGKVDVLVLTIAKGNAGLNLQRAQSAIFFSNDYKLGWRENAEDRCHRLGSECHDQIDYYDLIVANSIDGVVRKAHQTKTDISKAIYEYLHEAFYILDR